MLSDLAFRLADQGVSVAVVTSRQLYENACAALPGRETIRGVTVHRVNTANWGRARLVGRALDYATFHLAASLQLRRILSRGDVVVAKTDPPLISIAVASAARSRGALLVNWLQDLFPEVASAIAPGAIPRLLEQALIAARDRTLRQAAMNVVLSEGMRARLLSRGVDDAQVRIIPNWADATTLVPRPSSDSLTRRRLGLTGLVVGYSGNLGRAHEFDTLLGAARLLRADGNITFLITGSGAKAAALRRTAAEEGLDRFVFQDYQPPELLGDSLAASDVHLVSLLPQLEGLIVPSKIYGILAAGRPAVCIGDPDGDLGRLVRESGCGLAVRCGDSTQLAAGLRALRDQPDRLADMGARARELALARYRSEHAVRDWLDLLAGVAPQVGRPAASACHTSVTAGA